MHETANFRDGTSVVWRRSSKAATAEPLTLPTAVGSSPGAMRTADKARTARKGGTDHRQDREGCH